MPLISDREKNISGLTLREVRADDDEFLYKLYASTRAEEMAVWGLGAQQQEMILKLQFTAQRRHYDIAFAGADHKVILLDERPAGRMLVYKTEQEIRLVDIALLPEHRGAGIGAGLIKELLVEADEKGLPVTLHVEKQNRAARLYERLGFRMTGDTGGHFKMERRPDNGSLQ